MEYVESTWRGFRRLDFTFEGRECILILPEAHCEGKKWLMKTEYFDAFPEFEIEMLNLGYAVAHMKNITRWNLPEDTDMRPKFCEFLHSEYGFDKRCMPVGMSCGGMQAIYFAAKYPEYVAAMFIDSPVLNLLSCPAAVGKMVNKSLMQEFVDATGMTLTDLINYRNHPVDHLDELVKNRIPTFMVCGEVDDVVPYDENGIELTKAMEKDDYPFQKIIVPGRGHHPHGLADNSPVVAFAKKYY